MRVVLLDLPACLEARDWFVLALARAHHLDRFALAVDHFLCSERAARSVIVCLDERACLDTFLELSFGLHNRGVTHSTYKPISKQVTLLDDCCPFQVFLPRVGECLANDIRF